METEREATSGWRNVVNKDEGDGVTKQNATNKRRMAQAKHMKRSWKRSV